VNPDMVNGKSGKKSSRVVGPKEGWKFCKKG
jgi:hypothetical protein